MAQLLGWWWPDDYERRACSRCLSAPCHVRMGWRRHRQARCRSARPSLRQGRIMKFMCLVYNDDSLLEAMPEDEFWAFSNAHVAVDEELKRRAGTRCWPRPCSRPGRPRRCACAAVKPHVIDGPYAEAKEVVGGIFLI